jgi:RNA polymerase sigma factor (sigma-70 family)
MSAQTGTCDDAQWSRDLEAARTGDVGARNRIIGATQPYFYLLYIANEERVGAPAVKVSAPDLVQDTLVVAVQRFVRFTGRTPRDFLFWLQHILLYKLANFKRSAGRRARRERAPPDAGWAKVLASEAPAPPQQLEQRETLTRLDRLLAKLPLEDQQIIRLREAESLPFNEIGRRLGCSAGAAEKRFARAFKRLLLKIHSSDR